MDQNLRTTSIIETAALLALALMSSKERFGKQSNLISFIVIYSTLAFFVELLLIGFRGGLLASYLPYLSLGMQALAYTLVL